jgi:hypothetical protein
MIICKYLLTVFLFYFSIIFLQGCGTSFKEMSDSEFWNEDAGRFKKKTDSSYIYQVEMFDTEAEYKKIEMLDNPTITSNFTKILLINNEGSADTNLFYTIRITQKKRGFERITKPINDELYLKVNSKPLLLNIKYNNVQYVPPLSSPEYGYKNGYYYCDVMCQITYEEFVRLANAITISGTLTVNTTILGDNNSADGEIKFTSSERSGDAQIINRFFNTNPTK